MSFILRGIDWLGFFIAVNLGEENGCDWWGVTVRACQRSIDSTPAGRRLCLLWLSVAGSCSLHAVCVEMPLLFFSIIFNATD